MTAIDWFRLAPKDPNAERDPYTPPRSEVLRDGRPAGLVIDGARLEAQFAVGEWSLLLVTDDTPYEETLRAYLLDRGNRIVEQTRLSYAYTPGVVRDLQVAGERALIFAFTPATRFRLTVHDRPRHFWNAPGGVSEAIRFLSARRLQFTPEPSGGQQALG